MLNKKRQALSDLLYTLDFDESKMDMPNQQKLGIEMTVDSAEDDNCFDEVEKIVRENMDKSLMDVLTIVWHSDLFTPLEITDDDEDEDNE